MYRFTMYHPSGQNQAESPQVNKMLVIGDIKPLTKAPLDYGNTLKIETKKTKIRIGLADQVIK